MGFNSFRFILIFLPILLCGWYGLNKIKFYEVADLFLVMMSIIFYDSFGEGLYKILLLSIFVNYGISVLIYYIDNRKADSKGKESIKKIIKVIGVLANLLLLFYFKYLGFFTENLNALTGTTFSAKEILMPIGISFFTFGQISFIIDRANGEAPCYSFTEYALYTAYFPKLTQGPIAFHKEMIDQFKDKSLRHYDADKMAKGIMAFIIGLSKKVLLADNLAKAVNYGFTQTYYLDTITVALVMLAYTFEIYLDFSGYCDMAYGVSLMLGYKLPVNFNSPYKAASSKELWQRWHMTLSRFFIKYVYIPLGGSRKGKLRTMLNVLIVFVLSGLWHGAGWTYICWGLMQGLLVVFDNLGIIGISDKKRSEDNNNVKKEKYLLGDKALVTIPRGLGNAITFVLFLISLVFFGSKNMTYALQMFKRFFFWTYPGFLYRTVENLAIPENYVFRQLLTQLGMQNAVIWVYMITFILLLAICAVVMRMKNTMEIIEETTYSKKTVAAFVILFVWSFISLSNVSTFIYFQF
ncbi:MBOAT family O-acyltransferase [Butyrivibrio sp. YAB3001]|uniref:MBOAT family O-acyltransferase n=1 Tax=Butyrivibrio sp. YAB3001 TaxID=1520812 RepID=UPI0008F61E8D|nr:MBOAT family O-acyltransferase [Butyrivibrio sp. YAB3001]SFC84527.1 D-alanyl-lipoteichoic acid acyltransferase DltB, MBOAT superfamily [Butyrivibrio sp. YAB3001]